MVMYKGKKTSKNTGGKLSTEEKLQNAINELSLLKEVFDKQAAELVKANKELAFEYKEKENRAEELIIANKELIFQNEEKDKRAAELLIANEELAFQNKEKEKRATALVIANKELAFQTEEKHKRAEELLIANRNLTYLNREQQAFFAAIVNASDDAMLTKTLDGIITSWNRGAEKMFGYNEDEIIGKHVFLLIPPQLQHEEAYLANKLRDGKTADHYETERVRKDGTVFYASLNASPIRVMGGDVTGGSEILRDISDRKNAARDLEKSEKFFRALIENNQGIISLTDDDLNIIYRSPSSARVTGWTEDDMKLQGDINYFHPDDISILKTAVEKAIERPGSPKPYIARYRHKNGHYIWFEGTATKLPDNSIVKGIVFNTRDVTERIELEQLLVKANTLARIGNWEVDLVKGTVYWSDITREIHEAETDFVPNLATGINFYKEGPSRELITQKINEAIELGKPWDVELQIITAQNNERWIRAIGETEFVDGICVKIYGSFQDIDQRKKAEVQIQESENRYRRLFDTSPIAITEEDHTPFYEKVESLRASGISKNYAAYFDNHSEEFYEMLGRVQIHGVNQSLLDLTGANNLEDFVSNRSKFFVSLTEMTVFKLMDLIRDGGGYFEEETKIKSLSGEIRDVVVRLKYPAAPPYNSVAITMRDVTKQKEFEKKITESENRMRLATSSAALGIWYWDTKNDHMVWDERMYQIYNINESQLGSVYAGFLSRLHPDDKDRVNEVMQTAMRDKKREYGSEFRIIWDDLSVHYIKGTGITEYDDNGNEIKMMGINWDVTETRLAEVEIKSNNEQLRQLTSHLETIRDEERNRIAREIHDELGQQLTAIKMDVAWIDKNTSPEAGNIKSKLKNIITLLDGSNQTVRKILNELRSGTLDHYGIIDALEWHTIQFRENTGIAIQFSSMQTDIELPQEQANCIFRIYQESLTNIMRYAQAGKVLSSLNIIDNSISLSIEDDGTGFNEAEVENTKSFGLLGMKERVRAIAGQFELTSSPGKGTKIVIHLPYKA